MEPIIIKVSNKKHLIKETCHKHDIHGKGIQYVYKFQIKYKRYVLTVTGIQYGCKCLFRGDINVFNANHRLLVSESKHII